MRKRRRNVKKRKRRKVPKDKATDLPKKYLSGLKGSKRSARASLIKTMSSLYKSGARIPASLFRMRGESNGCKETTTICKSYFCFKSKS